MKFFLTGIAGFIGFHLGKRLLDDGFEVVGYDNLNDYYDVQLKLDRLKDLGVENMNNSWVSKHKNLKFVKADLLEKDKMMQLFQTEKFDYVIHFAAQAGVRYSLTEPQRYIDSNITGFMNVLECCRNYPVKHLIFASSSSVYGLNSKIPFSESDRTDNPISIYAASKKSNELMAHTYSHLFKLQITGLRFFTVYGPWGRPDMAMHLFTEAICNDKPIDVFNHGKMIRDFTYVSDIIESISRLIQKPNIENKYQIFNIGNSSPVEIMEYIEALEKSIGKISKKNFMENQAGDVYATHADVTKLENYINFKPQTSVEEGVKKFVDWFLSR